MRARRASEPAAARAAIPAAVLAALAALGCSGSSEHAAVRRGREALARAAHWLWAQQRDDGSFRSGRYSMLRSGQAMTPFVLHALLAVPAEVETPPPGAVERGLAWVRRSVSAEGSLGYADPDLTEYPVYATSFAILALTRAGHDQDRELVARMARWLASMQYRGESGFDAGHVAHGGFGFGARGLPPGEPGHMDLTHTRRALQALAAAGALDPATRARAETFLALVQRRPGAEARQPRHPGLPPPPPFDGGFYLSPAVTGANKSGGTLASYATATCDGLLALLACGAGPDDPSVRAARAWLADHPGLERPAGIPVDAPVPWYDALTFYHLAVRGEAGAALGWHDAGREALVSAVTGRQRPDGSFVGTSPLMKEDDPLLATALATIALTCAAASP